MKNIKNIKKISDERLCAGARLILRLTAPLVIIQALALICWLFYSDPYAVFTQLHVAYGLADGAIVSLILSIGGSLLADALERRNGKR